MPTDDLIDTDTVHKLFAKFSPENDREKLYKSLFIAMSERADAAENALRRLRKEVIATVAEILKRTGLEGGGEEQPATSQQQAAQEPQAGAPGDKTPFPDGFKWKADGPPAGAPPVAKEGVPAADVVSGPATNTQPIPPQSQPMKGSRGKQA